MSGFGYLCPECLEVPAAQCAYRGCPQRGMATSAVASLAPGSSDATRAVSPGTALPNAPLPAAGSAGDALATRFVDPGAARPPAASPPPAPMSNPDDALATRYVGAPKKGD